MAQLLLLICVWRAVVVGPWRSSHAADVCSDDKQDFGLEFLRPKVTEETLPWLSEHILLLLHCVLCLVYALFHCLCMP